MPGDLSKKGPYRPITSFDLGPGSRRRFLGQAGLLAGAAGWLGLNARSARADVPQDCSPPVPTQPAVPFTPESQTPLRQRLSAWDPNNQSNIAKLKQAYSAMRQLSMTDPTDPRGWQQQANVHCWYCGGGGNGIQGESIHFSWWFFAWHRCYLYFHERILGKLISDQTVALAYWDWDNPQRRTLPPPFVTPNDPSNSLYDGNRGETPAAAMSDDAFANLDSILNSPSTTQETFFGINTTSSNDGGQIENGVHGYVHLWTGNIDLEPTPDMGVLQTAAQDPVFFAHHCNIDRLWDVWLSSSSRHQNYADPAWLTHRWTFYDENKVWTSISVADVLDHETSLRYTYGPSPPMTKQLALFHIVPAAQPIDVTSEPVTRTVEVPGQLRSLVAESAGQPAPRPARSFVLHIDGVIVPEGRGAYARVYVNLPNADISTSVGVPEYAGYFVRVPEHATPKTAHQEQPQPRNYVFNVTERIAQMIDQKQNLSVTLVPFNGRNKKPTSMKMSFSRIYLTVENAGQ
jgi:polyphenol oxidase